MGDAARGALEQGSDGGAALKNPDNVPCWAPECPRTDLSAKGLCHPHYMRWHRTGDPLPKFASREAHILSLIDRSGGPDACWPWQGCKNAGGYGTFGKPIQLAHRVVFTLLVGREPVDSLDHECHNRDPSCMLGSKCPHRRCCNPSHLKERTTAENTSLAASTRGACGKGHPRTPENNPPGRCRACERERTGVTNPRGPYKCRG